MSLFESVRCEWWQALVLILAVGMSPIFMAFAAILVGRFVRPELAKIALPLILSRRPWFIRKPTSLLPRPSPEEPKS